MNQEKRPEEGKGLITIEPEMENGRYSNAANIIHSFNEFILDFIMLLPGDRQKVVSRIVTSPAHAKQLAEAMERNVRKYETTYGKIKIPDRVEDGEFSGPIN